MTGEAIRTTLGVLVAVAVVGAFLYRWLRWTRTTHSAAGSWKHTLAAWTSMPRPGEGHMSARRAVFMFGPPLFGLALAWGLIVESGPWWHRVLGVVAALLALAWASVVVAYFRRPVETTGSAGAAPGESAP